MKGVVKTSLFPKYLPQIFHWDHLGEIYNHLSVLKGWPIYFDFQKFAEKKETSAFCASISFFWGHIFRLSILKIRHSRLM